MKTLILSMIILLSVSSAGLYSQCSAWFDFTQSGNTFSFNAYFSTNGDTINEPAVVDYMWEISNDNFVGTGQSLTYTFSEDGLYLVCLTATGEDCTVIMCDSIIVGNGQNPGCNLTIAYNITHALNYNTANGAINITVSGGTEPYAYEWSNGSATQDLENLLPGYYTVAISDSENCFISQSFHIMAINDTVNNDTVLNSIYVSTSYFYANQDDCSATVYAMVYGGQAPYTYYWSNGLTDPEINDVCGNQMYCVTVMDSQGEMVTGCVYVYANYNGQDSVNVVDSLVTNIDDCLEDIIMAEIASFYVDGDYIVVTWSFITEDSNQILITVTYLANDSITPGMYELTLIVNCDDGQKALSTYTARIELTENHITLIRDKSSDIEFLIYPNPVVDFINIQISAEHEMSVLINIYNASGQIVRTQRETLNFGNNSYLYDATDLSQGIYLINIAGNGINKTLRIVK